MKELYCGNIIEFLVFRIVYGVKSLVNLLICISLEEFLGIFFSFVVFIVVDLVVFLFVIFLVWGFIGILLKWFFISFRIWLGLILCLFNSKILLEELVVCYKDLNFLIVLLNFGFVIFLFGSLVFFL